MHSLTRNYPGNNGGILDYICPLCATGYERYFPFLNKYTIIDKKSKVKNKKSKRKQKLKGDDMFRVLPADIFDKETGIREKLRIATVGGFEGIEIDIQEADTLVRQYSPAYVKGMLDSFNLKAGVWKLPFSLSSDQTTYEKAFQYLDNYGRVASYLEAFRVISFIEPQDRKPLKDNLNFYIERITPVAKILSNYGCKIGIGIEDHKYFLSAEIKQLCRKIKTGNAGFILSARQWHLADGQTGELKKISKDEIVYVLVGDVSSENKGRYLPGETGVVNLPLFLNTLAEIGYDGPVSPEMPDRDLLTIPSELAVRLLGGAFLKVWNRVFTDRQQD
ncbi:MAG: sugar phosphate isomerase/epimerase [Candidatus Omnitrophica bacterium]|nr:sugar phosphate isomerase/epimerase [Candidatus Omnitrophota bacterium]